VRFKNIYLYIVLGAIIFLAACSESSTSIKIYEHMEESVELEYDFEVVQDEIVALEEEEQDIFHQITELGQEEFEEIKELSQAAIASIQERSNRIDIEKESINASQEEFEKAKNLIDKLEEQEVKDKATEMYGVMMDRYQAYEDLHEAYAISLEQEEAFYLLFQKEEVEEDELVDQITVINETYEKYLEANERFNENTNSFNTLKEEFYTVANLNVEFEED
jgi:uncharacterized coiled-coil DUF342 family protein